MTHDINTKEEGLEFNALDHDIQNKLYQKWLASEKKHNEDNNVTPEVLNELSEVLDKINELTGISLDGYSCSIEGYSLSLANCNSKKMLLSGSEGIKTARSIHQKLSSDRAFTLDHLGAKFLEALNESVMDGEPCLADHLMNAFIAILKEAFDELEHKQTFEYFSDYPANFCTYYENGEIQDWLI